MMHARDLLFNLLCNAVIEITIFATAAALLAPFLKRVRPAHLHLAYLAMLFLCLAAPVANTLRHTVRPLSSDPEVRSNNAAVSLSPGIESNWTWPSIFEPNEVSFRPGPNTKDLALVLWLALVSYGLLRFVAGMFCMRKLCISGLPLSRAQYWPDNPHLKRTVVLRSGAVQTPVALGVLRPVILIPETLLSRVTEHEFRALLAHETAHIRRSDFAIHLVAQVLTLPVALHPGIRYLMARISQTRELACDEDAAAQLGKRRSYARALLHLSYRCAGVRNHNAVQLGVFDGSNLEERIMLLTKGKSSLSKPGLAGLLVAATITFGSGAILARATSLQTSQQQMSTTSFVGTWHWMVRGQPFATMILKPGADGLSGTVTQSHIGLAGDGSLDMADPVPNAAPAEISEARANGSVLHVKTKDGFEFSFTLTDANHASIQPVGAPPNMKPIPAEKVR